MSDTEKDETEGIVAYEMGVKGPLNSEWSTHYYSIDEVPEDPEDAWRDDHRVRNVRPLTYYAEGSSVGTDTKQSADTEINDSEDGEVNQWFIHRFECPNCNAVTRADRAINCFRCGSEMNHVEQIAEIEEPDL